VGFVVKIRFLKTMAIRSWERRLKFYEYCNSNCLGLKFKKVICSSVGNKRDRYKAQIFVIFSPQMTPIFSD
jgi:hypothetical protein